ITCAKFINADIALVICAPERGAVSPNFPHLLTPDRQGESSSPCRPCGVLCQSLRAISRRPMMPDAYAVLTCCQTSADTLLRTLPLGTGSWAFSRSLMFK